jgi:putative MATE family efflux protein
VLRDDRDRKILLLALPALGTLAVEPIYILVDTAMVGRLIGTEALGALNIAMTALLVLVGLVGFTEYGITAEIAYSHGSDRADVARLAATNAVCLAGGLGLAAGAVLAATARPLASALGGRGDVLELATTYLRISAIGVPAVLLVAAAEGIMRGVNQLRRPLVILFLANLVNVVLEVLFVKVLDWGIAGSAWSTVLAQVGAAAWILWILRPHLAPVRPSIEIIAPQLRTGAHLVSRVIAMNFVWVTTTRVSARVDTLTLAANQIGTQLFMFLALVIDCYAIPAQSLVPAAIGAGDIDEAVDIGHACNRLSVITAAALGAVLIAGYWLIPRAFTGDGAVIDRAGMALLFLAAMQVPGAIAFAFDGALLGARDGAFLAGQAWRNLVAFLPLMIATLVWPSWGIAGLWGAQLMWMTMRAWVNWRRFHSRRWTVNFPELNGSAVT